jgi:hypothetical protein
VVIGERIMNYDHLITGIPNRVVPTAQGKSLIPRKRKR